MPAGEVQRDLQVSDYAERDIDGIWFPAKVSFLAGDVMLYRGHLSPLYGGWMYQLELSSGTGWQTASCSNLM